MADEKEAVINHKTEQAGIDDITVMTEDFHKLDELFDSIVTEIEHPETAGSFINPFIVEKAKKGNVSSIAYNVAAVTESVSVIIVRVSEDGMKAVAKVISNATSFKPFTAADIKRAANENGVFFGLDEVAIAQMVRDQTINKEIVIATGNPPKDGRDGKIEFNYEVTEEAGIPDIEKDTELARIRPPLKGRNGEDVRGHILAAVDGKEAELPIGDGIRISSNKAYAMFKGTFVLRDGLYSVVNELVLTKNVDRSSGIIGFEGTVIINGNVGGNAVVRAGRGVIINGIVSNAEIEAESNIELNGRTTNATVISRNGNITGLEINESTLTAGGGIRAEVLSACNVKCVTGIMCNEGQGKIFGGRIQCAGDINCLTVGNREHIETVLVLGDIEEYLKQKEKIQQRIGIINAEIGKLNEQVNMLIEKKKNGTVTLEEDGFLNAASRIKNQKTAERTPLIDQIKEIDAIIELSKTATLRTKTMLYGGAILTICGHEQIVNSDMPRATTRSNGNNVVIT